MTATVTRNAAGLSAAGPFDSTVDALVVGAGPYGLSTCAFLRGHGLRVRIAGRTMATWKTHMPHGMYLKSTPAASNLAAPQRGHSLADYCAAAGLPAPAATSPVPIEVFTGYGSWFADHLVPDVEPVEVESVERSVGGFVVTTGAGERIEAAAVVVASGLIGHAYVPPNLSAIAKRAGCGVGASGSGDPQPADKPVSHSSEHTDLSAFAGREVAVVGAGQSALESAALLAESGALPIVVARRPRVVFAEAPDPDLGDLGRIVDRRHLLPKPGSPLGPGLSLYACAHGAAAFRHLPARARLELVARILGPSGAWWLRDRVEGVVPLLAEHQVVGGAVVGDRITVRVGGPDRRTRTIRADHLLAATGYRIGPDAFGFLAPRIRSRLARLSGWPALGADFESSIPGLYFVGFPAAGSFGPLMRFVCGTAFAAPRVAAAVAVAAAKVRRG
jgi:FAD-dependent urate hydroxylase